MPHKIGEFKHSEETKKKLSLSHSGNKNYGWKGNKVGYRGLHYWIRTHKPKSFFCERCGKITDKLDVANMSGKYKRDISDFQWLCKSCHIKDMWIVRKKNKLKKKKQ